MLPCAYEEIGGWETQGTNILLERNEDEELFDDISRRVFIDDPTQ